MIILLAIAICCDMSSSRLAARTKLLCLSLWIATGMVSGKKNGPVEFCSHDITWCHRKMTSSHAQTIKHNISHANEYEQTVNETNYIVRIGVAFLVGSVSLKRTHSTHTPNSNPPVHFSLTTNGSLVYYCVLLIKMAAINTHSANFLTPLRFWLLIFTV